SALHVSSPKNLNYKEEILPDGHYVIVNFRQRNVAALTEPRERSSLIALTYSSWNAKGQFIMFAWSLLDSH
ncbi:hypothetical protein BDZ89DRAFT_1063411, partial [Hymenopellis radicata]